MLNYIKKLHFKITFQKQSKFTLKCFIAEKKLVKVYFVNSTK